MVFSEMVNLQEQPVNPKTHVIYLDYIFLGVEHFDNVRNLKIVRFE